MLVALGAVLAAGCADAADPELPEPPDGAELVLTVGELEVYKVFEGELCAGTLRRTELHVEALSDLFEIDPPRARVFLYGDTATVDEACSPYYVERVWGCAPRWGANAFPASVRHELVHVFVHAATDHAQTRPFIEEGVAWRLQGDRITPRPDITGYVPFDEPMTLDDLDRMLGEQSPFSVSDADATHFFAWAIDEIGLDDVLDAHIATSELADDEEVAVALAEALGFASLEDLHAAYLAGSAVSYPRLPDTLRTFTPEELDGGAPVDLSCAGEHTEGPMSAEASDELVTTFNLTVARAGEHYLAAEPLFLASTSSGVPAWQPSQPLLDPIDPQLSVPAHCMTDDWETRVLFHYPGLYESRTTHSHDEGVPATFVVRDLDSDVCTDP